MKIVHPEGVKGPGGWASTLQLHRVMGSKKTVYVYTSPYGFMSSHDPHLDEVLEELRLHFIVTPKMDIGTTIAVKSAIVPEVLAVINERDRQITDEGWSLQHDDDHMNGELANAAVSYLIPPINRELVYRMGHNGSNDVPEEWPIDWDPTLYKPAYNPNDLSQRLRELEKGLALGLAEYGWIHRLRERQMIEQSKGLAQ